jgi:hypothetical protein
MAGLEIRAERMGKSEGSIPSAQIAARNLTCHQGWLPQAQAPAQKGPFSPVYRCSKT